jgi:UDP-glucose 4-epimerase
MANSSEHRGTVLITGAAGNIGSALAAALIGRERYFVVGVDNLSTGARHKLPVGHDSFRFIKADVNNYAEISSIFYAHTFDYVFHFAAVVGVQRTLANPLLVLDDIDGIRNVLSLSKNCGVRRVFYSSSSEVYGEPVRLPQHEETTPLNSRLPYAIVKNVGEAYFKSYYTEHELPYTIFRFFNTYGPNQSDDFVVPRFVNAALQGEPLTVYGDGSQTRTFCFVDDNTDTMIGCLEQGLFVNDVLNVGSDIEYRVIDLAHLIIQLTGSNSTIEHLPALKEGDMTRRKPDISKMRRVLNRPLLPVEQGIQRLINHSAVGALP